ncbi:MAG: hypothetical protein JSS27_04820 [Planctomycetes bacterium]|nr:hypothetical protein [Planctomycetota bacterium]
MCQSNRFWGSLVVLAVLGLGVIRTVDTAEPAAPASGDNKQLAEINLKYAEATLALAQAELNKALGANKRFANTYPSASLEYLHRSVDIAQQRLDAYKSSSPTRRYEAFVAIQEGGLKIADADYQKALTANQRTGASVSADELERLRCTAEVARLRYERAKLAESEPTEVVMGWQLQELADEVLRLRGRVEMLSRRD